MFAFFFFFDDCREMAESTLDELCKYIKAEYDIYGSDRDDRLYLLAVKARALYKLADYE